MTSRSSRVTDVLFTLGFLLSTAAYAQEPGGRVLAEAGAGDAVPPSALVIPPMPKPSAAALGVLSEATAARAAATVVPAQVAAVTTAVTGPVTPADSAAVGAAASSQGRGTPDAAASSPGDLLAGEPPAAAPVGRAERRLPATRSRGTAAVVDAGADAGAGFLARVRAVGAEALAASSAISVAGLGLLLASLGLIVFALLDGRPAAPSRSASARTARRGLRGRNRGAFVSRDATQLATRLRSRGAP